MLTDKRKEKISAFLDDDMHSDELMSFSLSSEPEDAKVAQRYQMLGDTLRGEMSDSSFIDVSSAVREALADENLVADNPVDQIAAADSKASTATSSTSGQSSAPRSGLFDLSGWLRPLTGVAVAASVAVVMVVSISEQGDNGIAPVASTVEQKSAAMPDIRIAGDDVIRNKARKNKASDQASDQYRQVNHDLVNQHLEFATQDALQGRMPYVRAVSFEKKNAFNSEK